jgi:hypothetical protein
MKTSDIFGLIVRVIGLLLMLYGLWYMWGSARDLILTVFGHSDSVSSLIEDTGFGIPVVLLGSFFLFFADWIIKITYRK